MAWAMLAGLLAVLGTVLAAIAGLAQENPAALSRDLGTIAASGSPPGAGMPSAEPGREQVTGPDARVSGARPRLPAPPSSFPVSLAIPAIGVQAEITDLGLESRRTLQVPPLTEVGVREAGWYDLGPAPGQQGPAVIVGHVDSYQGPGVFFRLGALRPDDQIRVTRADGTVAVFQVDAVDEYRKDNFPDRRVYGPVSYAGLRVITCGGRFDYRTRHYLSSIVVYATLTSTQSRRSAGATGH